MREYTATELANNTGDVLSAAAQEAVEITRHGKPRFVIMTHDRFQRLKSENDPRRALKVTDMAADEAASLIAALETSLAND